MRHSRLYLASLIAFVLIAAPAIAQINWMSPLHGDGVTLEASRIGFGSSQGYTSSSAAYSLSARFWPWQKFGFVVEIPFASAGIQDQYLTEARPKSAHGMTMGNPFLGLEFKTVSDSFAFTIGGRLPLADELKIGTVHFDTLSALDRPEAFIPKLSSAQMSIAYRSTIGRQCRIRLAAGPTLLFPKAGTAQAFVNYSAELWFRVSKLSAGAGIGGRCWLPVNSRTFDARTTHQLGANIGMTVGKFRPGIHVRYPLDKIAREYVDAIYGLSLTINR